MKWIKASERLPDMEGQFFIKQSPFRMYFNPDADFSQLKKMWRDNKYEWLDESAPPVEEGSTVEEVGVIAVKISENIKPELSAQEQALFIAGFQECAKYASQQTAKYREALERIAENPYPEDIFPPIPPNVLEMIADTLKVYYNIPLDRLSAHIARQLRSGIKSIANEALKQ